MSHITATAAQQREPLPRTVSKHRLCTFFSCDLKYLWRNIITDDLLEEWGSSREEINRLHDFPPHLTRLIFIEFRITDLNADFSKEIEEEIRKKEEDSSAK